MRLRPWKYNNKVVEHWVDFDERGTVGDTWKESHEHEEHTYDAEAAIPEDATRLTDESAPDCDGAVESISDEDKGL